MDTLPDAFGALSSDEQERAISARRRAETRYDSGPIVCMASAQGYRMVRRPRCAPFVLSEKEWLTLSAEPKG